MMVIHSCVVHEEVYDVISYFLLHIFFSVTVRRMAEIILRATKWVNYTRPKSNDIDLVTIFHDFLKAADVIQFKGRI